MMKWLTERNYSAVPQVLGSGLRSVLLHMSRPLIQFNTLLRGTTQMRCCWIVTTEQRLALFLALLVSMGVILTSGLAAATAKDDFDVMKSSAYHGDAKAQYRLGLMYATGQGTAPNLTEAATWYRKAAEQGHVEAQSQLGSMYETGQGLPQNLTEAIFWYNEAAAQDHPTAKLQAAKILQDIAAQKKAAEQGEVAAQLRLGEMYAAGNGVPQEERQAVLWYQKAADQGSVEAECHLGNSYAEGKGVEQDYTQAVTWYRKAAERGNAEAQYRLGSMYHKGRGVPQSGVEAYAWLSLAATQGYEVAVKNKDFAISRLSPTERLQAEARATELQAMIDSKRP